MDARILTAAALLLGSAAAPAQLTCTPGRLLAGAEIRIGSPGAFGGAPSADVVLTYRNTAGGSAVRFVAPRSWSAREVAFVLPPGLADGAYEVALSSPAGAMRNPACFAVGPQPTLRPVPLTGGAPLPLELPSLDTALDGDNPCPGDTKITLWGKRFQRGTEAQGYSPEATWTAGKTMVELSGDGTPTHLQFSVSRTPPRLVVKDAGTIEYTVSRCLLLLPGLKARIWFPDGTKSAWRPVLTQWNHPGAEAGVAR